MKKEDYKLLAWFERREEEETLYLTECNCNGGREARPAFDS